MTILQTPSGSPYLGGEEAQLLPVEPCLPVGLNADMTYLAQEVVIEPKTTIFFYTDGLNEAMDADNKEFGDDLTMLVIQYKYNSI